MAADRPYGEFHDFYSISQKYFGFTLENTAASYFLSCRLAPCSPLQRHVVASRWATSFVLLRARRNFRTIDKNASRLLNMAT
jgi:hypothetical protein